MRKQLAITTALASAVFITGCANTGMSDTTRRTVTGAGVGALGGAAVGAIAGGHAGTGAVIGAGFFKEKLSALNMVGVALAIGAIVALIPR